MTGRYCPAWGPGSSVCPRDMCDCFIDQFPNDMEQAGALHPEFYEVVGRVVDEHELTLDGPLQYPGGKDGMYHVVCSCGRYLSPPGTNPDSARMWDAARQHQHTKRGQG